MTTDGIAEERPSPRRMGEMPPQIAAVGFQVTDLEQQARTLIRQRPVAALLAALGVGYLVARLIARGSR